MVQQNYLRLLRDFSETKDCQCGPDNKCDGLECLCRPRFFAGQLLTDEDLRRLDHYIVAKNRLHNRYLHGTGVVCGMEVVCNACDDTVTVRTGYAIGPCGEDIVVCNDTSVDVGELIRGLRKQLAKQECRPNGDPPKQDCDAAEQKWILAVCYEERASRGVTSLKRPSKSGSCGCGCSGHSDDGHSHASNGSGSCSCQSTQKAVPAQCEPTVLCEGYRFKLIKEKKEPSAKDDDRLSELMSRSELAQRVMACLLKLVSRIQQIPNIEDPTPGDLAEFCCDFKSDLREVIETGNVHECTLYSRLNAIVCPDPNDEANFNSQFGQAFAQLFQIAADLFKSCVCSALLPPCSIGSPDDCVPLATLTVRTSDLRVLRICNWSARKFVVTIPTLNYWLGWLPIFDNIRDTIVRLCCSKPRDPKFRVNDRLRVDTTGATAPQTNLNRGAAAAANEAAADTTRDGDTTMKEKRKGAPVIQLAEQYWKKTNPLSGLEATILGALGAKDLKGEPLATELEIMNPFSSLALLRIGAPVAEAILPEEVVDRIRRARDGKKTAPTMETGPKATRDAANDKSQEERMAKLEASLAELHKTVASQKTTIANLQKQGKSK